MADIIRTVIVDTDVVSFGFKGDTRAALYDPYLVDRLSYISFQTLAELEQWTIARHWGTSRRDALLEYVKERFSVIESSPQLCRQWAEVRERLRQTGRAIAPTDAWIAATAMLYSVPLITHNKTDFEHVPGLTIISTA